MKVDKSLSLSESVHDYLLDMILSMEMKPGEKISEEKIANIFGSSRAPIRDALKRLENEGIINIYPRRFAEVAKYTDDLIKQIGVVRVFHDLMAIKLSLLYGSKADFLKMRTINEECLEAAKAEDTALRIKKDCEFHLEMGRITQNQQLIKFAEELYIRIEFIQSCRYTELVNPQEQYRQHSMIIDLLIERNEKKVMEALAKHDSNFHGLSKEYPLDFFISK